MYTGNTLSLIIVNAEKTVYPCVYREHANNVTNRPWSTRFIPVYTGNTRSKSDHVPYDAVYPCVYREHTISISDPIFMSGLSLCIQGTLTLRRLTTGDLRFIPVYTGNTHCQM